MTLRNIIAYLANFGKLKKIKMIVSDIDGVMTDGKIHVDDNGVETKVFNVYDGIAIKTFQHAGFRFAIISASPSKSIMHRFSKFKVDDIIFNMEKKIHGIISIVEKYNLDVSDVLYIGDDLIDVPPMKYVSLSFAPSTSVKEAKKAANAVLSQKGGEGVVREVIKMTLMAKGVYSEAVKYYTEYK